MAQISRLEKKVLACIESHNYYEAHQVYRTLYYRMVGADKHDDLLRLLYEGSFHLYNAREWQSGIDLAQLFVDVLSKSSITPSQEVFDRIVKLLAADLEDSKASESDAAISKARVEGRQKFIADAVRWSQSQATKNRERKRGLSALHLCIGRTLWSFSEFDAARNHLLVAEDPEVFAEFLVDMHLKLGHATEDDLFITLAVLQLLCIHRVTTAARLIKHYVSKHPALKDRPTAPYTKPLLNFVHFLVIAAYHRKTTQFLSLVEKYQPSLDSDVNYKMYLDKIGQLFFGLPPPASCGGGIFGGMLKGLLGDDKKEETETFSDSDMEADELLDPEGESYNGESTDGYEDGYITADEEETESTSSKPSLSKVLNMKLGDLFPDFAASTDRGVIDSFHSYIGEGKWAILFSHPADFTPVCTTELARAAVLAPEFGARNVTMLALSCDSAESHRAWIHDIIAYSNDQTLKESPHLFPFEIVADEGRVLATELEMLDPQELDSTGLPLSARAVFIIGPNRRLRAQILYPASTGRNFDEILRVIDSMQLADVKPVATPEGWVAGGDCMVQPSLSDEKARSLFGAISDVKVPSGRSYLRMIPQPSSE